MVPEPFDERLGDDVEVGEGLFERDVEILRVKREVTDFNTVVVGVCVTFGERLGTATVVEGCTEYEACNEKVAIPVRVLDGTNGVADEHLLKILEAETVEEVLTQTLRRPLAEAKTERVGAREEIGELDEVNVTPINEGDKFELTLAILIDAVTPLDIDGRTVDDTVIVSARLSDITAEAVISIGVTDTCELTVKRDEKIDDGEDRRLAESAIEGLLLKVDESDFVPPLADADCDVVFD